MVKNEKSHKSCYLSCVLHGAHESQSKTSIQNKNKRNTK